MSPTHSHLKIFIHVLEICLESDVDLVVAFCADEVTKTFPAAKNIPSVSKLTYLRARNCLIRVGLRTIEEKKSPAPLLESCIVIMGGPR